MTILGELRLLTALLPSLFLVCLRGCLAMLITDGSYVIQKMRTGHTQCGRELELRHKRAHECNFAYSVSIARNSCLVPMLLPEYPAGQQPRPPAHSSRRPESGARQR